MKCPDDDTLMISRGLGIFSGAIGYDCPKCHAVWFTDLTDISDPPNSLSKHLQFIPLTRDFKEQKKWFMKLDSMLDSLRLDGVVKLDRFGYLPQSQERSG